MHPAFGANEPRQGAPAETHPTTTHSVSPRNDATDSYLGFLFQGLFALLLLWDAEDGDAVSIEGDDDVVLEGEEVRLNQLKHSLGTPPDLRVTNVGFWKAVGNWVEHLVAERPDPPSPPQSESSSVPSRRAGTTSDHLRTGKKCVFVTVANVAADDPLVGIVEGEACDVNAVVAALTVEAERVGAEREAAAAAGTRIPHAERGAACAAFLRLTEAERRILVERMTILPRHFRITDVSEIVADRLSSTVVAKHRPAVAERVIEWWDRQVALALMKRRSRRIFKVELTTAVHNIISEHRDTTLPDNFSFRRPSQEEIAADRGGNIERQIELVRGGVRRADRAIIARWQARGQRGLWMARDVSLFSELTEFDDRLKEAWVNRHGPMCDDCEGLDEDGTVLEGRKLLDWAHHEAPREVPPPRPLWDRPFYAQGMLQQFADELTVGWHPEFAERLGPSEPAPSGDAAESDGKSTSTGSGSAGAEGGGPPPSVTRGRAGGSRSRPRGAPRGSA